MLVNENVIEQLCVDAGSTRTQKAKKISNDGKSANYKSRIRKRKQL